MSDDTPEAAQRALDAARSRRRRASLGPPLNQDDATLDALSQVSEHDIAAVESFVRDSAGQLGVDLLRATKE